jgi:Metallopeptidase family M24
VIIGSGSRALLFRYAAGMRRMDPVDQLSLEWAGTYRHYHAAMMRTLCVGEASDYQRHLFCVVREALEEMTEALSPGRARSARSTTPTGACWSRRAQRAPLRSVRVLVGYNLQPQLDGLAHVVFRKPGTGRAGDDLLSSLYRGQFWPRCSYDCGTYLLSYGDG